MTFPPLEKVEFTQEQFDAVAREIDELTRCPECKTKLPSRSVYKELCYECQEKKEKKEKSDFLRNHVLDHTVEQRLRIIESWMYDHKKAKHGDPFSFVMR